MCVFVYAGLKACAVRRGGSERVKWGIFKVCVLNEEERNGEHVHTIARTFCKCVCVCVWINVCVCVIPGTSVCV